MKPLNTVIGTAELSAWQAERSERKPVANTLFVTLERLAELKRSALAAEFETPLAAAAKAPAAARQAREAQL